jgi:hypothetical protein
MDGIDLLLILEGRVLLIDALDPKIQKAGQEGVILFPFSWNVLMQKYSRSDTPKRHERNIENREAGFGPASNRLAETFSLSRSLSSPQQPIAVGAAF